MNSNLWFRKSTWTHADREEFDSRLKRSRGAHNKSQYIRIQALHLANAGLHREAIELLDRFLIEFPEDTFRSLALSQKADSFAALGDRENAIATFRTTLQVERGFPNVKSNAWIDYAWYVTEQEIVELYDEVLDVMKEFRQEGGLSFPIFDYRYYSVRALIAKHKGDRSTARSFALKAREEALREHSGLRYHPTVGLVTARDKALEKRVDRLVNL